MSSSRSRGSPARREHREQQTLGDGAAFSTQPLYHAPSSQSHMHYQEELDMIELYERDVPSAQSMRKAQDRSFEETHPYASVHLRPQYTDQASSAQHVYMRSLEDQRHNEHTSHQAAYGSHQIYESMRSENTTHTMQSSISPHTMPTSLSDYRVHQSSNLRETYHSDDFEPEQDATNDSVPSSDPAASSSTTGSGSSPAQHLTVPDIDLLSALRDTNLDSSRYAMFSPSSDSLLATLEQRKALRGGPSQSSLYTVSQSQSGSGLATPMRRRQEAAALRENLLAPADHWYPAWPEDEESVPISIREIRGIFQRLQRRFGFQVDNARNQYDALMRMLDSRASRQTPHQALLTLHADYIGGQHANYRLWYFCALLDKDVPANANWKESASARHGGTLEGQKSLSAAEHAWRARMREMTPYMRVRQLALWLLIWGEASVVRFMPEALCFLFKLADDSMARCAEGEEDRQFQAKTNAFLDDVITPLYCYIRDQAYELRDGRYVKRERDHANTVSYDDCNELFWTRQGIYRIRIKDSRRTRLMDLPEEERYAHLSKVDWKRSFHKTYKERRTFLHLLVNFPRIWIIHVCFFYFYTMFNAPFVYDPEGDDPISMPLTIAAQGGSIAILIMLFAAICELFFVRATWSVSTIILNRILWLIVLLAINVAPTFYIIAIERDGTVPLVVSIVQFIYSILCTASLALIPSSKLFRFGGRSSSLPGANLTIRTFTASFPKLKPSERAVSIGMWTCVFVSKFLESYFFLALSFKDALKAMIDIQTSECLQVLNPVFCTTMGYVTLVVVTLLDLLLFFLDTYLWYIVWNTIFSVCRSFYLGISIYSPWRNIFSRLPKRIYAKLVASHEMAIRIKPRLLASQLWNAVVVSMYREHLITAETLEKMLYQHVTDETGQKHLKEPTFFIAQEDSSLKGEYFSHHSEAERRFSYFAQSLATTLPEPVSVERMPTFTVLTPHYSEKILLSLKEIIRENDKRTRITLLEYLKKMHRDEWENFVRDSKLLAEEMPELTETLPGYSSSPDASTRDGSSDGGESTHMLRSNSKLDDIAYQSIGYKSATPEFTLRTRIWASLRSQTLYRTVSGFMNYARALRLLYRVEHPECPQGMIGEMHADQHAKRKFYFLISMQRYTKFDAEELECVEFLLKAYPDLQIAYLEEEMTEDPNAPPRVYSVLIDGRCEIMPDGRRRPKYRIQLPGNPILGDGKADNQNHAIIFMRGEYLQLIDANQDNYLEEALKIRNVLAEFEQFEPDVNTLDPYDDDVHFPSPVAIVGAREFIFSQNIGVLGDLAAGKETTFGTLTHRILAKMGGRLHYGHPDFLNAIFMNTRGGVSKATKGLHLNEDIYAGMTAFQRGGRIKHTEYFQCGKGRDLGFGSVLNFNTKIGTGMAEQFLSREQYYIGTQLPLDRFLTFFYAHPGFQINNVIIMIATQMFMYSLLLIGVLRSSIQICDELPENAAPDAQLMPPGCFNVWPIMKWIKRCVINILTVFLVAFLPLFLQMMTEQGVLRAITRLLKQFLSLSPLFEVFATQTFSSSIMSNLSFGGARYIGTGRGVAITRLSFATLYSRFASTAIYMGLRLVVMLLFASIVVWVPHMSYFWLTNVALCISPFIFNPHQFILSEFIIDYRDWLIWMSSGNVKSESYSWINHCRTARTRITGFKRKRLGDSARGFNAVPRASKITMFVTELLVPIFIAAMLVLAYVFLKTYNGVDTALIRITGLALLPIVLNAGFLAAQFFISILLGNTLGIMFKSFGSVMAAIAHGWAVVNLIATFMVLYMLEEWDAGITALGVMVIASLQRAICILIVTFLLTREYDQDASNLAWWTGRWIGRGLGWGGMLQPIREWCCKIVEASMFATDFIAGHLILFVLSIFCLVPFMDRWHTAMLFWLPPSRQFRQPIYSPREARHRRNICISYGLLFVFMFIVFMGLMIAPQFLSDLIPKDLTKMIPL